MDTMAITSSCSMVIVPVRDVTVDFPENIMNDLMGSINVVVY